MTFFDFISGILTCASRDSAPKEKTLREKKKKLKMLALNQRNKKGVDKKHR
jgi:hypothetical protein